MITLAEHQFEILPDELSLDGVGFGIGLNVSMNEDGWDPGDLDRLVQDTTNELRGTRNFGRDKPTGTTHTFGLHVNRDDVPGAVATLEEIKTAWTASSILDDPGRLSVIRYFLAGRYRRFYGRPRRFAAPPTNRILGGYVPITCSFDTVDHLFYEDDASSISIPFVLNSTGGMTFPVTFPISSLPGGQREGLITVAGTEPTHPVIRFNGPVVNPYLSNSTWTLQLNMTIGAGQYVEIDTRPWKQTVLRQGLYSEADKLARRTYLSDIVLKPGPHDLAFGGTSSEGGATVDVTWRGAYASI